ncbi:G-type lectin S-receptor-like serine/threonine-protein kinase LECRK4 [Amborella trichopoda]|uniref:Receptor-like serine/threonine-protein kinase n=1 Tax=Amborella trichopoda TaxID=13333 RepID=W1PF80_AMBTC|nr:G-type lectin S-receptor-like serine/threonine-protein kinase LECRK4 [Amborella trichopoda]ERN05705.1 hypothetical protein AMTR_s00006p00234620 [Amborella trichopoda]|eukprot:XP_006844030.1 G-type lectin S-receptor-like serine/threonine-protein kinase LECRK4 [Amborella trichopoda]
MAAILLVQFLLLVAIPVTRAQSPAAQNISLGSSLSTNPSGNNRSYWLSPSGFFAFGLYPLPNTQTFLVGIWLDKTPEKTLVWCANRDSAPLSTGYSIILTTSGSLILRSPQSQAQVIPLISDNLVPTSFAAIRDDGNFVLYASNGTVWQSFDSPTDTILPGQNLKTDAQLYSSFSETNHSKGKYMLNMPDLQLYYLAHGSMTNFDVRDSYWSTQLQGVRSNLTLILEPDGRLHFSDSSNSSEGELTGSDSSAVLYRATLGVDGNFRRFSYALDPNGAMTMNSNPWSWIPDSNPCQIKGRCGLNSFCKANDNSYSCMCPSGFESKDPLDMSQGCERNFSIIAECRRERGNGNLNVAEMESLEMVDNAYENLTLSQERCKQACLDDCSCALVLFINMQCKKQALPLKYMKQSSGALTQKTFVKVGSFASNPTPSRRKPIIWATIVLAACSFLLTLIIGFLCVQSRVSRYKKFRARSNSDVEDSSLRLFSYEELEDATGRFLESLGKGSFGAVFKGELPNGVNIAVKKLHGLIEDGEREFRSELTTIGKTHHKNLVQLLGYCDEGSHRLLVYQFMSNGSLANVMFNPETRPNWAQRVEISLGIARGVLYLHEECETQIIHCDIKPQNILLDNNFTPKISDFGLAKLMGEDQTRTFTDMRGTRGYVAPEWHRNLPITVKVDVYSFGIMLLEIICCRKRIEMDAPEEEIILFEWVYNCFETRNLKKLVGVEEVEMRGLQRMVMVGLWCVQEDPSVRPSMRKVVSMLDGTLDVQSPPNPSQFL